MGEVIWLERLARNGDVLARHRFGRLPVVVGRGYAADLLIDDPAVAAQHLRIGRLESGELFVEDLGSINGLLVGEDKRVSTDRVLLQPDALLRIGDTRLRVRSGDHEVAPERRLGSRHGATWTALGLGVGVTLLTLLDNWLAQTGEPSAMAYLSDVMIGVLASAVWAGGWALASRLFAGTTGFSRHLALAYAMFIAFTLLTRFIPASAYSLSWSGLLPYRYVLVWMLIGLLGYGHLRIVGRGYPRTKLAAMVGLSALGIGWGALAQSDAREKTGPSTVVRELLPPAFRLSKPATLDAFMASSDALHTQVDAARKDPPPD